MGKKIFITAGLFAAAVLSISLVAANNARQASAPEAVAAQAYDEADVSRTIFQVSNLSCGSCLATIQEELDKYDGMVGMEADLGTGLITVGHTSQFPGPQVAEAITQAGYPARLASAELVQVLQQRAANGGGGRSGCGSGGSGGCGSGGCGTRPPQG